MEPVFKKKKFQDDRVFQQINSKYLTLDENETKENNQHLKQVLEQSLIPLMKENELFKDMYQRIVYGGSFYKKTKFGKPEEFDLDFIFKLPVNYKNIFIDTDHDNYGFVKILVNEEIHQHPLWEKHKGKLLLWFTQDGYLCQDKFRSWIESVLTKAINKLSNKLKDVGYEIKQIKSGPAFTLKIEYSYYEKCFIDVDLVPCLEFDKLLGNGYRNIYNSKNRNSWIAVPKPLVNKDSHILWRLSFYEQEKDFLKGDIKDVIRMLKKFRDTKDWKPIASYYIETIFYHELLYYENMGRLDYFVYSSKTGLFMHGLKKLQIAFESENLPYFWHSKLNLLSKINRSTLANYANYLEKIISRIDKEIETNRYILAQFLLNFNESISDDTSPVLEPEQNQNDSSYCSIL